MAIVYANQNEIEQHIEKVKKAILAEVKNDEEIIKFRWPYQENPDYVCGDELIPEGYTYRTNVTCPYGYNYAVIVKKGVEFPPLILK